MTAYYCDDDADGCRSSGASANTLRRRAVLSCLDPPPSAPADTRPLRILATFINCGVVPVAASCHPLVADPSGAAPVGDASTRRPAKGEWRRRTRRSDECDARLVPAESSESDSDAARSRLRPASAAPAASMETTATEGTEPVERIDPGDAGEPSGMLSALKLNISGSASMLGSTKSTKPLRRAAGVVEALLATASPSSLLNSSSSCFARHSSISYLNAHASDVRGRHSTRADEQLGTHKLQTRCCAWSMDTPRRSAKAIKLKVRARPTKGYRCNTLSSSESMVDVTPAAAGAVTTTTALGQLLASGTWRLD